MGFGAVSPISRHGAVAVPVPAVLWEPLSPSLTLAPAAAVQRELLAAWYKYICELPKIHRARRHPRRAGLEPVQLRGAAVPGLWSRSVAPGSAAPFLFCALGFPERLLSCPALPALCLPPIPAPTASKAQTGTGAFWAQWVLGGLSADPDCHPTPTPCPTGLCRHPQPRVMVAVGHRITGVGIGPHTFSPVQGPWVQALSTRGAVRGCWALAAPCAQRSSLTMPSVGPTLSSWFKVQLWVWSSAVSQPSSTPRFLVRPSSCPGSRQPFLPGASSRGISGTPFPWCCSELSHCPALGHGAAAGFQLCPQVSLAGG